MCHHMEGIVALDGIVGDAMVPDGTGAGFFQLSIPSGPFDDPPNKLSCVGHSDVRRFTGPCDCGRYL